MRGRVRKVGLNLEARVGLASGGVNGGSQLEKGSLSLLGPAGKGGEDVQWAALLLRVHKEKIMQTEPPCCY